MQYRNITWAGPCAEHVPNSVIGPGKTWYRRTEYPSISVPFEDCFAPNSRIIASRTCLAVTARWPQIKVAVPMTCISHPGSSTTTRRATSCIGSVGSASRKAGVGGRLCRIHELCHTRTAVTPVDTALRNHLTPEDARLAVGCCLPDVCVVCVSSALS